MGSGLRAARACTPRARARGALTRSTRTDVPAQPARMGGTGELLNTIQPSRTQAAGHGASCSCWSSLYFIEAGHHPCAFAGRPRACATSLLKLNRTPNSRLVPRHFGPTGQGDERDDREATPPPTVGGQSRLLRRHLSLGVRGMMRAPMRQSLGCELPEISFRKRVVSRQLAPPEQNLPLLVCAQALSVLRSRGRFSSEKSFPRSSR